jgi:hypothetical protein
MAAKIAPESERPAGAVASPAGFAINYAITTGRGDEPLVKSRLLIYDYGSGLYITMGRYANVGDAERVLHAGIIGACSIKEIPRAIH